MCEQHAALTKRQSQNHFKRVNHHGVPHQNQPSSKPDIRCRNLNHRNCSQRETREHSLFNKPPCLHVEDEQAAFGSSAFPLSALLPFWLSRRKDPLDQGLLFHQ